MSSRRATSRAVKIGFTADSCPDTQKERPPSGRQIYLEQHLITHRTTMYSLVQVWTIVDTKCKGWLTKYSWPTLVTQLTFYQSVTAIYRLPIATQLPDPWIAGN